MAIIEVSAKNQGKNFEGIYHWAEGIKETIKPEWEWLSQLKKSSTIQFKEGRTDWAEFNGRKTQRYWYTVTEPNNYHTGKRRNL